MWVVCPPPRSVRVDRRDGHHGPDPQQRDPDSNRCTVTTPRPESSRDKRTRDQGERSLRAGVDPFVGPEASARAHDALEQPVRDLQRSFTPKPSIAEYMNDASPAKMLASTTIAGLTHGSANSFGNSSMPHHGRARARAPNIHATTWRLGRRPITSRPGAASLARGSG